MSRSREIEGEKKRGKGRGMGKGGERMKCMGLWKGLRKSRDQIIKNFVSHV